MKAVFVNCHCDVDVPCCGRGLFNNPHSPCRSTALSLLYSPNKHDRRWNADEPSATLDPWIPIRLTISPAIHRPANFWKCLFFSLRLNSPDEDQLQIWISHYSSTNNYLHYYLLEVCMSMTSAWSKNSGNINIFHPGYFSSHSRQVNVVTWFLVLPIDKQKSSWLSREWYYIYAISIYMYICFEFLASHFSDFTRCKNLPGGR